MVLGFSFAITMSIPLPQPAKLDPLLLNLATVISRMVLDFSFAITMSIPLPQPTKLDLLLLNFGDALFRGWSQASLLLSPCRIPSHATYRARSAFVESGSEIVFWAIVSIAHSDGEKGAGLSSGDSKSLNLRPDAHTSVTYPAAFRSTSRKDTG